LEVCALLSVDLATAIPTPRLYGLVTPVNREQRAQVVGAVGRRHAVSVAAVCLVAAQ